MLIYVNILRSSDCLDIYMQMPKCPLYSTCKYFFPIEQNMYNLEQNIDF